MSQTDCFKILCYSLFLSGSREELHFIQGGAPICFALSVRAWLNNHFVGSSIGRRGPAESFPRSPGFTPCDWFLWGCAKQEVYLRKPEWKEKSEVLCRSSYWLFDGAVTTRLQTYVLQDARACVEIWHWKVLVWALKWSKICDNATFRLWGKAI